VKKRVAVIGAGNGGQALAGHLGMRGFDVSLLEDPRFEAGIAEVRSRGAVELKGALSGFGPVRATTDPKEALEGVEVAYFVVPSFGQMPLFTAALPFLDKGTVAVFVPGNLGSLEALQILEGAGRAGEILLAETDTMPYACRLESPGCVHVGGIKKGMSVAALPGSLSGSLAARLAETFPVPLEALPDVLTVALSNLNMVVHCASVLLNAGRIEATGGNFRFYTDGATPSIGKLMEGIDRERLAVGKALGLGLSPAAEWFRRAYPVEGERLHELLSKNPVYAGHGPDAPKTMRHRYVTEDVPNLLVPLVELGRLAGVPAPLAGAVVTLLSEIAGEDFTENGRNLKRLGLAGMTPAQARAKVRGGGTSSGGVDLG
jgi:opine dehydrogenase